MAYSKKTTAGLVGPTSLLIGTMSLGLALGMGLLGFWDRLNALANGWTSQLGAGMREVPANAVLLIAMVMAYAPAFLLLSTPTNWRRIVIWLSFLLVGLAWLPVLALAAWQLPPAMPMAAGIWSGLCALIYASRHRLPCDGLPSIAEKIAEKKSSVTREVAISSLETPER